MRGLLSTLNKSDDRSPDRHRPLVSRPRLVNLSTTLQALQEHLATHITQSLTASNHYDLLARIPVHDSYGDGYYWVWSKRVGEARSAESVVCKVLCTGKIELNMWAISRDARVNNNLV